MPDARDRIREALMSRAEKGREHGIVRDGRPALRSAAADQVVGSDANALFDDITNETIEGVWNFVPGNGMSG